MKSATIIFILILLMTCTVAAFAAQTCNNAVVATTPTSRFIINADVTVADSATGLVWKRCSEGQSWDGTTCTGSAVIYTWQSALQIGSDAVFAGTSDWRLPNKNELASLVERHCVLPAINSNIFPATPASGFWTSSPYASTPNSAWYVYFYDGGVYDWNKNTSYNIRLVRGEE